MDFYQNTTPETDNNNQNNLNNTPNSNNQYNLPDNPSGDDTTQNINSVSGQAQTSYDSDAQSPHQAQQPYESSAQSQQPVQQSYGNDGRYPYQNGSAPTYPNGNPYANNNGNPYYGNPVQGGKPAQGANTGQNNSSYGNGGYNNFNNNNYNYNKNYNNNGYNNGCNYNNNGYNNGYNYNNNGYNPNYGRYAYPVNVSEPGSKLANAAMILGIISIVSFFSFIIYPALITGSIAIVLALLSKGRQQKMLSKARTGIICAIIALVLNALLITGTTVRYFTDDDFRTQVNQTYEELYGQPLDEMIEEMLENSGYTD